MVYVSADVFWLASHADVLRGSTGFDQRCSLPLNRPAYKSSSNFFMSAKRKRYIFLCFLRQKRARERKLDLFPLSLRGRRLGSFRRERNARARPKTPFPYPFKRLPRRLVSPAKIKCIKWRHFGANYLRPCLVSVSCACVFVSCQSMSKQTNTWKKIPIRESKQSKQEDERRRVRGMCWCK